ncbi:hypothetical protein D6833_13225 [Candidatus Parcubacteria bacterium]|nr:MAG: hypothetical protein D6833_13225 [Candidatus Parcubacteria bacterium]
MPGKLIRDVLEHLPVVWVNQDTLWWTIPGATIHGQNLVMQTRHRLELVIPLGIETPRAAYVPQK